ncbi:hypothetical protein GY45DRAFT_1316156 [Cubamyces sp. BRFM 1775]|nr:hypothetical protein GY45DRAFT_1316156 [Cubamyces sp. BRFM 1775]
MQLTFSPALGEQTVLKVAPVASGRPASQSVLFKATFNDRETLLKARADGVKVEVWSDIPVDGRSYGEWGALPFRELEATSVPHGAPCFSLASDAQDEDDGAHRENSLYVHVRAPFHEHIRAHFHFTYRLVYPSGEVKWLGEFGRNGELVIEQGLPGVDLREGWNISDDGTYRTHAFPGDRVLGYLTDPRAWSCWSWQSSSLPKFTGASEASEGLAMVLPPRPYAREVNVLRPLVFVASHSTSLKITEQGQIILHSSSPFARVSFSVLEHSRDLLEGIVSLCGGEVAAFDDDAAVLACCVPGAELPMHLVILPMIDNLDGRSVFPLKASALPKAVAEWDGMVLSSPDMQTVKFVPGAVPQKDVVAWVGAAGGELIVSPAREAVVGPRTCHVALLTPHQGLLAEIDRSVAQTLPTPPPSPPPSSAQSRTPADPPQEPRPVTPRDPVSRSSPRPAGAREKRRALSRPPRSRSTALIPYESPRLFRRYLHMVLNVVFWFWSVFVRSLTVRLVGESMARRVSGLLGLALLKTAYPAPPKASNGLPRPEEDARDVREDASDTSSQGSNAAAQEAEEPDTPPVSTPLPRHSVNKSPEAHDNQLPSRLTLSVGILSEAPVIALRGIDTLKDTRATIDGKSISSPSVISPAGGVQLLKFGAIEDGKHLEVLINL